MENLQAGREIFWNLSSPINAVVMYLLLAIAVVVGVAGTLRRVELWASGKPNLDQRTPPLTRILDLLRWGIFQRGVVRETVPGVFHTLIYVGFLVLLFTTTMVFLDHDLGLRIYNGDFYLAVTLFSDLFGAGLLIGCALAARRRFISSPDFLHNQLADALILGCLAVLIIQGFVLEGLRIRVTQDPWAQYSPIGNLVAGFFWGISDNACLLLHKITWWSHTVVVMLAIAITPYTKFFHVCASTVNLYFRSSSRPKGALAFAGDLEKMVESGEEFSIGLGSIKDYSWKNLLDLDACTSCGRCQDVCPAYASGKPLSPKWLILDTRNHALGLHADGALGNSKLPQTLVDLDRKLTDKLMLPTLGIEKLQNGQRAYVDDGAFRGQNTRVQKSVRSLSHNANDAIMGGVLDPAVFWSCNTCLACVEACPVGINHVDQIVGNRRNSVLMQGSVPDEAQKTLKALENRSNPYGAPEDRIRWFNDLDVPVLKPGDQVDYLYWVGCVSAYDPRKQKIARALVTLMKSAGLSFGVLGTAEGCSGDPARRLGEENLFQSLAKKNIETLKSVRFKTIVANCPHCFNSIKNEYPQFGNLGDGQSPEIIHHSQLLKRLLSEGKLVVNADKGETFTFHDPCYLGRANEEYEAPRQVLKKSGALKILEMEKSREKSMCCGAGGGHFWFDMKVGERVNSLRVDQAASTGASKIATACPFCMQMLEDGVKLRGLESSLEVKDIAEVLVERLEKTIQ